MTKPRNFRKRLDLPALAGALVAAGFVGVSGVLSVAFALRIGNETGWLIPMLAAAVVSQAAIAGLWPLTFGRGRVVAGLVATIALIPCTLYSWGAAYDFARTNFATAESARAGSAVEYEAQRAKVARIRRDLDAVADAAPVNVARREVDREIWRRTSECTDVTIAPSQNACQPYWDAKERAKLEGDLAGALAKLDTMDPAGAARADGGPALVLAGMLGVADWAALMGWCMMLMSEAGALFVPLAVALAAGGQGVQRRRWGSVLEHKPGGALPDALRQSGAAARGEDTRSLETWQLQDARAWRAERLEDAPGAKPVQYKAIWQDYQLWAMATGREIMPYNWFGHLLTHELGLQKRKSGTVSYHGVRLKAAAGVQQAREAA